MSSINDSINEARTYTLKAMHDIRNGLKQMRYVEEMLDKENVPYPEPMVSLKESMIEKIALLSDAAEALKKAALL